MPTEELATTATELRAVIGRLSRRLRTEAGTQDLTSTQLEVLRRLLQEGPATTSELAREAQMRPQSMSATIAALEREGLVDRSPDPSDGRAIVVSMSEHGTRAIAQSRAAKQGWLTRAMAERLTDAEQAQLTASVAILAKLLED